MSARPQPPRPTRPAADARLHAVHTADGVRLAVHRLGRDGATPVLLLPGTFSNHTIWLGTRGTGFARAVAAAGFEAWAVDPRGHGLSQRPRPHPHDRWSFDDWARHDVPAAIQAAAAAGPVFLVGHSAGGAVALAALAAQPTLLARVRGVVAIATPLPWLQPVRGVAARLGRWISLALGRFPAGLLRIGPEDELGGVMAQWMGWNIQGHWRGDDGTDYDARFPDLLMPFLALAGAGDRLFAPPAACRGLYDRIGSPDKAFVICGRHTGFDHDFDHTGLLVHRAARAQVWPRILDWLATHAR